MALAWAYPGLTGASLCSCSRWSALYLGLHNARVIHGKEKVYGSIP